MAMDLAMDTVSLLEKALPREFPFYHLGEVRLSADSGTAAEFLLEAEAARDAAFAYQIQGDLRGVLVICVDAALDASTYMEMGNIIASQLATRLGNEEGIDLMISPPHSIVLSRLSTIKTDFVVRTYTHQHKGRAVRIRTLILATQAEEAGNV